MEAKAGLTTEHTEYTEGRQVAQELTEGTERRGLNRSTFRRAVVPTEPYSFFVCSVYSVVINSGPWAIHLDASIHGASGDPPSKGIKARGRVARAPGIGSCIPSGNSSSALSVASVLKVHGT
jgi:hypothetical protein